jgi:ABC-type dipeptide/oligopeptide/nickel transport system permease component
MQAPERITGLVTLDAVLHRQWDVFASSVRRLILPTVVLGSFALGVVARMLRSSLVAALGDDYVRTARAKGVTEGRVVVAHALRNAMIPTITILGLTFASLLAGAVLTETVFSWPGIGPLQRPGRAQARLPGPPRCDPLRRHGYVVVNLLVDVAYGILDPRIRVS